MCAAVVLNAAAYSACKEKHEHIWNDGEITTLPTCGKEGVKTFTCTGCGETKYESVPKTAHPYSDEWLHNDTEHWQAVTCEHTSERANVSEHVWDGGKEITSATCTHTGLVKYTCVCGMTKTLTINKTGHKFAEVWSSDGENHWHACTGQGCTEKADVHAHVFDGGKITTPATCVKEGVKTYTCTDCKFTKTEQIQKTEHSFAKVWSTNSQSHWHACTVEGCTAKADEKEHALGDWQIAGQLVANCVCGYEESAPELSAGGKAKINVGGGQTAGLTLFTRSEGYYTVQCETAVDIKFTCRYDEWDFDKKQSVRYEYAFSLTPENNAFTVKLRERSVGYITAYSVSQDIAEITVTASFFETAPEHTHNYSSEWSHDGAYHWHACTGGCGEERDTALHEFDGDLCMVCGYNKKTGN